MLDLYRHGLLNLDDMVTNNYKLDDVNQGIETCWTVRTFEE